MKRLIEVDDMYSYDAEPGNLVEYTKRDLITWDEVSDWIEGLTDDWGGVVDRWYYKCFTIENLTQEQREIWETEYPEALDNWLIELDEQFPNYGEDEED